MPLSKGFVKANIKLTNNMYIVRITYSYYYIFHFDEIEVCNTIEDANDYVLQKRTDGLLSYN